MMDIVLTRRIAAEPGHVYALATDLANIAKIIPQIQSVEMLTPGPFGVGAKWRETRKAMGATATVELAVVSCSPGSEFVVECCAQGCIYRSTFTFVPDAGATIATMRTAIIPGGFWSRLGARLTRGAMAKGLQGDLDALAGAAEAR